MLYQLGTHLSRDQFDLHLIPTRAPGALVQRFHPWYHVGPSPSHLAGLRRVLRLVRAIRTIRPDVIHVHADQAAALAGFLAGVPLRVETIHTICRTAGSGIGYQYRPLLRCSTLVIAVAAHIRRHLIDAWHLPPEKVLTIPPAVSPEGAPLARDAAKAALGIAPDVSVIGYVGRLAPEKGVDLLVRAVASLVESRPGTVLVLVGDGQSRVPLELLAEDLGIEHSVRFFGYQHRVTPYLCAMDVFALPSLWEGLPTAALEAAALGVPVVGSDTDGLREALGGRGACLVRGRDPARWATVLAAASAQPQPPLVDPVAARAHVSTCYPVSRLTEELAAVYARYVRA
ncbi:MAG: glycosyltransferase [Armatimonadota bacterium]|nr:glycosyltransferase [Armatimonadota bacterium]